jgi:hypothetical protein
MRPGQLLGGLLLLWLLLACLSEPVRGRGDEDYFRGQGNEVSIVMRAHNNARYITSTLESVEESIEHFFMEREALKLSLVRFQVVIIDDNSNDGTTAKLHRFVRHRKSVREANLARAASVPSASGSGGGSPAPYPISRYYDDVKWLVVELRTASTLGEGTGKNLGVEYSLGEVLFFLDGRSIVRPNHITDCYNSLLNSTVAYIRTGSSAQNPESKKVVSGVEKSGRAGTQGGGSDDAVAQPGSHERPQTIDEHEQQVFPSNICIWRKVHQFIEGFPELGLFTREPQIGEAYLTMLHLGFPFLALPSKTVERIPEAAALPHQPAELRDAAKQLETEQKCKAAREVILNKQLKHLKAKLAAYKHGQDLGELNNNWRVHYTSLQMMKVPFTSFHNMDTRNNNYRQLLLLGDMLFESGQSEAARAVLNCTTAFLYNTHHTPSIGVRRTSTHDHWPSSQFFSLDPE